MLKIQPTFAALQLSRLTLAASLPAASCKMSTADGAVRPPRAADAPEEFKHQPELKPSSAFLFPLGYKDAAYQWVSLSRRNIGAQSGIALTKCLVDESCPSGC